MLLAATGAPPAAAQEPRFEPSYLLPVDTAWTTVLDSGPRHAPAYDAAQAYVALRNDTLVAVDLLSGEVVWTVGQGLDQPPVTGDGVVVGSNGRLLNGWRASDGLPLWITDLGAPIAAPLLWNTGWLVASTEAGELAALRGFDGAELWRRALGSTPTVRPSISGGRLFVPLVDGRIAALALGTGALLWERALPGEPQGILPLDALFVGSTDNLLYRLRLPNGAVDWHWRTGGDIVGAPIADREHVYFNSRDNVLRALDRRNGARRWRRLLSGRPTDGPRRGDSVIVVAGTSPLVDVFDAGTGRPRGSYEAPGELAAMHVIADAAPPGPGLVLITGAGAIVGLSAAAGPPQLPFAPAFGLPFAPLLPRPPEVGLAVHVDWFTATRPAARDHPAAIRPDPGGDPALPPPPQAPRSRFPAPDR